MIEYHSISSSVKAPRKQCIAFDKLDGSSVRVKYTHKAGFCLFGTRTQLIEETAEFWGEIVTVFKRDLESPLMQLFKSKRFRDYKEIIVFGEFLGESHWLSIVTWIRTFLYTC